MSATEAGGADRTIDNAPRRTQPLGMENQHTTQNGSEEASAEVIDLHVARRQRHEPDVPAVPHVPPPPQIMFHRTELDQILRVYGRKVAEGEWRDYAIDFGRERAVFSCFRRASEMPQFRIVKDPKLARRQGQWSVVNAAGATLKRGRELAQVLRMFDRKPKVVR